jgi:hypothetical protein
MMGWLSGAYMTVEDPEQQGAIIVVCFLISSGSGYRWAFCFA